MARGQVVFFFHHSFSVKTATKIVYFAYIMAVLDAKKVGARFDNSIILLNFASVLSWLFLGVECESFS